MKGRAELFAATNATSMHVRIAGRTDPGAAERALVQLVSGEYLRRAATARADRAADRAERQRLRRRIPVAVISDAFWERRFRRDRRRRRPRADRRRRTHSRLSASRRPDFFGPFLGVRNPEVWVPLMRQPDIRYAFNASSSGAADNRKPWPPQAEIEWLHMFARVPRGADVPAVASALTVVHKRDALARLDADNTDGPAASSTPERVVLASAHRGVSSMRADLSAPLYVLLAMVGVLLAITCGNVASLLLARASAREREMAIRSRIGAGRWRVIRQLLVETMVLSVVGGALGLLRRGVGPRRAAARCSPRGSTLIDLDTSFDWRVLGFALVDHDRFAAWPPASCRRFAARASRRRMR